VVSFCTHRGVVSISFASCVIVIVLVAMPPTVAQAVPLRKSARLSPRAKRSELLSGAGVG
jgi:hypothetical protein